MGNMALKILDDFIKTEGLETDNFTGDAVDEIPKSFKPTSVLSIKKDDTPLFFIACNREAFWIHKLDGSEAATKTMHKLEAQLKQSGISQVK